MPMFNSSIIYIVIAFTFLSFIMCNFAWKVRSYLTLVLDYFIRVSRGPTQHDDMVFNDFESVENGFFLIFIS